MLLHIACRSKSAKKWLFCDFGIDKILFFVYNTDVCRRSLMVKPQLPKLMPRVRFPSPAPNRKPTPKWGGLSVWSRNVRPDLRVDCIAPFCKSAERANAGSHTPPEGLQARLQTLGVGVFAQSAKYPLLFPFTPFLKKDRRCNGGLFILTLKYNRH